MYEDGGGLVQSVRVLVSACDLFRGPLTSIITVYLLKIIMGMIMAVTPNAFKIQTNKMSLLCLHGSKMLQKCYTGSKPVDLAHFERLHVLVSVV